MRLRDKAAVVTGAASGIGSAIARRFAGEGALVMMADVQDLAPGASVGGDSGRQAFVRMDVTDAGDWRRLIDATVHSFGRLDILVNNAGIELSKSVTETTEDEWDRLLAVNLKGAFLGSREAIPTLRRSGGGVIVNVASELGLVGGSRIAAYCASKGGVVQLTRAMAVDHSPDSIRVNCVCPGPVVTPLLESIVAAAPDPVVEYQSIVSRTLLRRPGTPEEIANAVLFVASDEASYMTGAVLAVDGGWTAQ